MLAAPSFSPGSIARLSSVLDEAWPMWKVETLQSITDQQGIVREQVVLPIRAVAILLERRATALNRDERAAPSERA